MRHGEQPEPAGGLDSIADERGGPPDCTQDEVSRLFSVLTEREEEVVLLRMECFKYREIAEQLGINGKTVATLLARALRKLQQAFAAAAGPAPARREESNVPKTLQ
jgi:DNA-directed RNA polymerase specialized sigma24 family protein